MKSKHKKKQKKANKKKRPPKKRQKIKKQKQKTQYNYYNNRLRHYQKYTILPFHCYTLFVPIDL